MLQNFTGKYLYRISNARLFNVNFWDILGHLLIERRWTTGAWNSSKTPERRQWFCSYVVISHLFKASLLPWITVQAAVTCSKSTMETPEHWMKSMTTFWCLWRSECWQGNLIWCFYFFEPVSKDTCRAFICCRFIDQYILIYTVKDVIYVILQSVFELYS